MPTSRSVDIILDGNIRFMQLMRPTDIGESRETEGCQNAAVSTRGHREGHASRAADVLCGVHEDVLPVIAG